jgi:diketogulonate reductase-like aldo/keto reductase
MDVSPLLLIKHQNLTTSSYNNEDEVGNRIREFLSMNPDVKREDIFVTTKVWTHLMQPVDVEWSLNDSLKKLDLNYVDCLLLHFPLATERMENYEPMEDANEDVSIRSRYLEITS